MKKHYFPRSLSIFMLITIFMIGIQKIGFACTLWGAAGKSVALGGTLIAKNRDGYSDQSQQLRFVKHKNQFSFIGLYAKNGTDSIIKAGVNEYGLVIVNAAAANIKLKKRPHTQELIEKALSRCTDIADVLSHQNWFHGSRFLLLADSRKIAVVEIGQGGIFKVKITANTRLYHTNHYIEPGLKLLNPYPINKSSRLRLRLIKKYLTSQKKYSLTDFIHMSGFQDKGPDNSLWRSAKAPVSAHTLATWIVWQPLVGKPVLYVRLANPLQKVKEYYFDLNKVFHDRRLKAESLSHIYGYYIIPEHD